MSKRGSHSLAGKRQYDALVKSSGPYGFSMSFSSFRRHGFTVGQVNDMITRNRSTLR